VKLIVKTVCLMSSHAQAYLSFLNSDTLNNSVLSTGRSIPVPLVLKLSPTSTCWENRNFNCIDFAAVRMLTFNTNLLIIRIRMERYCKIGAAVAAPQGDWIQNRSHGIANILWEFAIPWDPKSHGIANILWEFAIPWEPKYHAIANILWEFAIPWEPKSHAIANILWEFAIAWDLGSHGIANSQIIFAIAWDLGSHGIANAQAYLSFLNPDTLNNSLAFEWGFDSCAFGPPLVATVHPLRNRNLHCIDGAAARMMTFNTNLLIIQKSNGEELQKLVLPWPLHRGIGYKTDLMELQIFFGNLQYHEILNLMVLQICFGNLQYHESLNLMLLQIPK
jgi:hypothetical protein